MGHSKPHFLHIGPEKTGTSWLYEMLSQHPDVHVNPVKEVRYFYEAYAYPEETVLGRFVGGDWHNRDYRTYLRQRLKQCLRHPRRAASLQRLKWDWSFLFGRRSDDWFESLFQSEDGKVPGDFSPQTFQCPPEHIARIAREWPEMKIVFALREPVQWAWSFARMSLIKNRDLQEVSSSEFNDFFSKISPRYPSVSQIEIWERAFAGRSQILFYDDIAAGPGAVLNKVCKFLDLATGPRIAFEGARERRNVGRRIDLPSQFREQLIEMYRDRVVQLADVYGGHPRKWLEGYQAAAVTGAAESARGTRSSRRSAMEN